MSLVSHAHLNVGVAHADITPPAGVYNRCWGAAKHDQATGVHRPLMACVWLIAAEPDVVLVSMDGSWWQGGNRERACRSAIAVAAATTPDNVLLCVSHSHAAVPLVDDVPDAPGADILNGWLESLPEMLAGATEQASQNRSDSVLQATYGSCTLASCRDQASDSGWIVGHDANALADQTVAIVRLAFAGGQRDGQLRSVLVNYACHPTSLAWENTLLSPDYVGALRDDIAQHHGVPLLFIQGAGGDLAPAWQYSGDTSVADRNGESIALSVRSTLSTMPPPGEVLTPVGSVSSGAELGLWSPQQVDMNSICQVDTTPVDLPWRDDFESSGQLDAMIQQQTGPEQERARRRRRLRHQFGDEPTLTLNARTARFGDILFFGAPAENYSILQQTLRSRFSDKVVLVANHCNGGSGYLMPEALHERQGFYPAWQSPMAAGSFESLQQAFFSQGDQLSG